MIVTEKPVTHQDYDAALAIVERYRREEAERDKDRIIRANAERYLKAQQLVAQGIADPIAWADERARERKILDKTDKMTPDQGRTYYLGQLGWAMAILLNAVPHLTAEDLRPKESS